ncbi:hypothetical protein M1145_03090 [Patescibacteria group bacterium]|nr:hypothetical protein [Patescibacteria group bacterium]
MDENVGEVQPQNNIVKTNSKFPTLLVTVLIVIIVLLLLLLLYLFFVSNKTNTHSTTAKQSVSTQKPKTNTSGSPYNGWINYSSPQFVGISFKYPRGWVLSTTKSISPFYVHAPGSISTSENYTYIDKIVNKSGYVMHAEFNLSSSTAMQINIAKYSKININGKSFLEVYYDAIPSCYSAIGGIQFPAVCTQFYNTIELFTSSVIGTSSSVINTDGLASGLKGTNAYLFSVTLPKTYSVNNNIPNQYLSIINHFFLSIVGL